MTIITYLNSIKYIKKFHKDKSLVCHRASDFYLMKNINYLLFYIKEIIVSKSFSEIISTFNFRAFSALLPGESPHKT